MAFILCPEHGGNSGALVCPHIEELFRARQPLRDVQTIPWCDGGTLAWICSPCKQQLLSGIEHDDPPWEELLEAFGDLDVVPVCGQCFMDHFADQTPTDLQT